MDSPGPKLAIYTQCLQALDDVEPDHLPHDESPYVCALKKLRDAYLHTKGLGFGKDEIAFLWVERITDASMGMTLRVSRTCPVWTSGYSF